MTRPISGYRKSNPPVCASATAAAGVGELSGVPPPEPPELDGLGDGTLDGVGVGGADGVGEGLAEGVADGLGEGLFDGVGDGDGLGTGPHFSVWPTTTGVCWYLENTISELFSWMTRSAGLLSTSVTLTTLTTKPGTLSVTTLKHSVWLKALLPLASKAGTSNVISSSFVLESLAKRSNTTLRSSVSLAMLPLSVTHTLSDWQATLTVAFRRWCAEAGMARARLARSTAGTVSSLTNFTR